MARGFVTKRSGSWYAVYPFEGRKKWERAGRRKGDADKLLSRRMNEINSGDYRTVTEIEFAEFCDIWLRDYARVQVKDSTYWSYETIFRKHLIPVFGNRKLHTILTREIQTFISGLIRDGKLSPKTAVNILVPTKEMFKYAKLWGYVQHDPTEGVKRPRVELREMDFLTGKELKLFLDHVTPQYFAFFATAALTGLRGVKFLLYSGET